MKAKKMISLILCGVMLVMPSVVYADEISGEASFNVDDSHEAFGDRGGRGDRGGMAGNGGGMRGGMGGSVENDPEAQAVIDEEPNRKIEPGNSFPGSFNIQNCFRIVTVPDPTYGTFTHPYTFRHSLEWFHP